MKTHTRAIVIGGGVVGVSILYHLAKLGWGDSVLCERTELTAGSTWHAAGLLPLFNMSYAVGQMHKYSVDLYKSLEEETGQDVSFHVNGNLRLAPSKERMDEFQAYCGTANTIGVPFRLVTPDEVKELWPLAYTDDLVGAIYHPQDGHIAPADLTMALAKGARNNGAEIYQHTEVLSITQTPSGEWRVETNKGTITAEVVVTASGFYAKHVARMVGLNIPVIPVEHQYIVTDEVPELVERSKNNKEELAVLREGEGSYYLREERKGFILGPYELGAKACFVDGVPEGFGKELFAGDLERLLPHVEACIHRVPCFENAGIKDIVNGPICYTPDGNPLLGPAPGLRNFYLAEGFSFGITAAGGAGKALAEQIVLGESSIDMLPVDPRRYGPYTSKQFTVKKNEEAYEHIYIVHYPLEERPAARPSKTTPVYHLHKERGAVFGQRFGWERANFFRPENPTDDLSFRRANWFDTVGDECRACRDSAALLDLSGFSKWTVEGKGAEAWLESLLANTLPKKDRRLKLAHALQPSGGTRSEFTITRIAENRYYLVSAGAAERYDDDFLRMNLPADGSVMLQNVTMRYGVFVVTGPNSRAIVSKLADTDMSNKALPWLSAVTTDVGMAANAHLMRVNFLGDLGYEIHHPIEHQTALFLDLEEAGKEYDMRLMGLRAMESMRLEKSYRMWGLELTQDYSPLSAGLDRFVRLDNRDFLGREGLLKEKAAGVPHEFITVEVDAADADCFGNEPIFLGNEMIGRITSGAYGHRIGKSLGIGYITAGAAKLGDSISVQILGDKRPAKIIEESPFDPENARLRG